MRLRRETGDFSISLNLTTDSSGKPQYEPVSARLPKNLGIEDFVGSVATIYVGGEKDSCCVSKDVAMRYGEQDEPVIEVYFSAFMINYNPLTGSINCRTISGGGDGGDPR